MDYNFSAIEQKWQQYWTNNKLYNVPNNSPKPKYYVLDMFPYPSGAGLHVGHPLGYIASDIYARYKRLKGFNVLHPMGYDSFGLPAEQYAIETGQHPAETTTKNIDTFRKQLDKIGFSFDWDREVRTSDEAYYKHTQTIFLRIFNSWYNKKLGKAMPIENLTEIFNTEGNENYICPGDKNNVFTAASWQSFNAKQCADILMNYRLAFSAIGEVNWCQALGTVLANDEVINGFSERGNHPVEKKKMRQWYLRITDYADRLLQSLETVDFSDAMKEMQRNWIGKSEGAEMEFKLATGEAIQVYTTRPDTVFGVDFLVLAPEHNLVATITTAEQKQAITEYLNYVKSRSDRERMAEVKQITGCFTGAFAINPFNAKQIPIYIAEYVLAGYGTGAIMAVPCGDQRDFNFAQHFNIPITNIIGKHFNGTEANPTKEAVLENSDFLNGVLMKDAIATANKKIEDLGIGKRKTNYRMRDAGFSRQRYWGEPFPIVWHNEIATALPTTKLPLLLPHVEKYGPGPNGQGPLANIDTWVEANLETSTMPGYAGSSWYFLRYMDPQNQTEFCDKNISNYWSQVDLYVGGTEHAVGHLLYSRMWTKILFDLDLISFDEPFKKLLNQGMIQGSSRFVHRIKGTQKFVSHGLKNNYDTDALHVDVNIVDGFELNINAFLTWRNGQYAHATFELENGVFLCGVETEKMSKSKYNTVNPNDIVNKYGADTFRMYEMFLGPVEQSKPWDTKGIEGVHRFLRKLWRLFYDDIKGAVFNNNEPTAEAQKIIHRTIKKIDEATEKFSYNTAVSAFMVCVNELTDAKCNSKDVLEKLLVLLSPYAPHIAEELWHALGNTTTILDANYPQFNASILVETTKEYPISINGKMRTTLHFALDTPQANIEKEVLANDIIVKWLEGCEVKKIIFVKSKMVNIVI